MSDTTGSAHPELPAHGDAIFVYNGPGLTTRLEGWALSVVEIMFGDGPDATRRRMVAVYRNAAGDLDISAHVSPLAAVKSSWHLVNGNGDIVGGGPRNQNPYSDREELEGLRDSGRFKFLEGSVPVYGIPATSQRSPSAGTDWIHEAPAEAVFRGARGGMYRWYETDAARGEQPATTSAPTTRHIADGPYAKALAAARKAGAQHAGDAERMALFCEHTLQHRVGAVSPQLVWEGAQREGLSTADLTALCAKDVMAVDELQWTTG